MTPPSLLYTKFSNSLPITVKDIPYFATIKYLQMIKFNGKLAWWPEQNIGKLSNGQFMKLKGLIIVCMQDFMYGYPAAHIMLG